MQGPKIRRRPRWRIWLPRLWLTVVGLFLLWQIVTYRGVAAFAGEWQFNTIGTYRPAFTFIGLLLLFSTPLLLLRFIGRRKTRMDESSTAAMPSDSESPARRALGATARLPTTIFGAAAVALIAALVIAILMLLLPSAGGAPSHAVASSDEAPPVGPVQLTGRVLYDKTSVFNEDFVVARRSNRFAPMVAVGSDETALRYFVELPPEGAPATQDGISVRTGVLRKGGLPGEVIQLYRYAGFRVDPNYYVLFASGGSMRRPYVTESLELLVLAAFLALLGMLFARRHRTLRNRGSNGGTIGT